MGELALTPVRTSAAKRRRALAVAAVGVAFVTTGTYWLASAGTGGPTITAPVGLGASGEVAEVAVMTTTVTRSIGGASLQSGKTIAKLTIAKDYTDKIRVGIIWTNPLDAAKVLLNPNAQISIGLYRPVSQHSSTCTGGVLITDSAVTSNSLKPVCAMLDTAATGSHSVSGGLLLLSQTLIAGFLKPQNATGAAATACPDASSGSSWCQLEASDLTANQRRLYVVSAITVPGGIPVGQTATSGSLSFYTQVKRSL